MDNTMAPATPFTISDPLREMNAIAAQDNSLVFPHFTAEDAWELGNLFRARLITIPTPVAIDISTATKQQLFRTVTHGGTTAQHSSWIERKRNTVLRFGSSTWFIHNKFASDDRAFAAKYGLSNAEYGMDGGGWPVKVRGVEGVVAVIVISGMLMAQDHQSIIQIVQEYLDGIGAGQEGEKKKED